jgi:hypothetical protein
MINVHASQSWDRHCRDHMVVVYISTYAISEYCSSKTVGGDSRTNHVSIPGRTNGRTDVQGVD